MRDGDDGLPKGWAWAAPDDIAARVPNALTIGPFGSDLKVPDYRDQGVPLVFVREIRAGSFGDGRTKYVDEAKAEKLARHCVRPGDLLITKMGDPPGDTAVYPPERPPAIITADCIKLTPHTGLTIAEFLRDCLRAQPVKSQVLEQTAGVAQQKLSLERFRTVRLPLPPLNEQRRIVAKLESLQARSRAAREALDAVPPLLEMLRQSILAAAFRGDLTKDWREKHPDVEPASELLKRIRVERRKKWEAAELAKMKAKGKVPGDDRWKAKYKEPAPVDTAGLPELPKGWCWASVGELGDVRLGRQRSPQRATGPNMRPYMRAANVTWSGISTEDVKEMDFDDAELQRYRLVRGDILLAEASGSPMEVGKPAVWNDEISDCCFQNTLIRVRPYGVSSEYLLMHFMADVRLGRFARAGKGVGINHLGADRMYGWAVALAPNAEQRLLVEALMQSVVRLQNTKRELEAVSKLVGATDRSILAKAFRGELVTQDPADEPAAVMLERIKKEASEDNGAPVKKGRGRAAGERRRTRRT